MADLLIAQGIAGDRRQAELLAELSEGSLDRAAELADSQLWQFRQELLGQLAKPRLDSVALARRINEFVDAAGKEAPAGAAAPGR